MKMITPVPRSDVKLAISVLCTGQDRARSREVRTAPAVARHRRLCRKRFSDSVHRVKRVQHLAYDVTQKFSAAREPIVPIGEHVAPPLCLTTNVTTVMHTSLTSAYYSCAEIVGFVITKCQLHPPILSVIKL